MTFFLTENQFSRKTYFYTIASRPTSRRSCATCCGRSGSRRFRVSSVPRTSSTSAFRVKMLSRTRLGCSSSSNSNNSNNKSRKILAAPHHATKAAMPQGKPYCSSRRQQTPRRRQSTSKPIPKRIPRPTKGPPSRTTTTAAEMRCRAPSPSPPAGTNCIKIGLTGKSIF